MNARLGPSAAVLQQEEEAATTATSERRMKQLATEFGTPQKIGTLMKARESEMQKLEEENYNLKLMLYNVRKELTEKTEDVRRLSEKHDFYTFDEGATATSRRQSTATADAVLVERAKMEQLEAQVAQLESSLMQQQEGRAELANRLERALVDARNQRALREKVDAENSGLHAEKMMLQQDRETLKTSVKHLTEVNGELSSRVRAAEAKAGGHTRTLNELVEKERERVREADRRTERYRDAVALWETSAKRAERRLGEMRAAGAKREAELAEERRLRTGAELQRNELEARLDGELQRAEVERSVLTHKCDAHIGTGPCPNEFRQPPMARLKHFVEKVNARHDAVNLQHDNLAAWRDTVLKEINESLRMLYCFQRQVEVQRDDFVREFERRVSIGSSIDGNTLPLGEGGEEAIPASATVPAAVAEGEGAT